METVYYFYDIYPKVIKANAETAVTIAPLDRHCLFQEGKTYSVTVVPMNHIADNDLHPDYPTYPVACRNGVLKQSVHCTEEQAYRLFVRDGEKLLCTLQIYGVEEDLYGLLPFKGNMHAHSFCSDGVESPEMVAVNYRKAGFDFLAITDHEIYEPSLDAIRAFDGLDLDFKLYPGEEVHAPRNKIHILNFAGEKSVNQFYRDFPEVYDPNWIIDGAYNIPPAQYRTFLKEKPFDALELINGGDTPYENAGQIALWHDACFQGRCVPVIGNDDSHGTVNGDWFNIGMTYVLARSNRREDLIDSIKKGLCIAVERYHNEAPHYYGEGRLVNLFAFLDHAYFPLHDELCVQEGFFMDAHLKGDPIGKKGLELLKGQTGRLLKKYF